MVISRAEKELIKNKIREQLSNEQEIQKIVLFGSFIRSNEPNDIDVAIFQNSTESYLSLALKYRKLMREIANMLPVDVIPLKTSATGLFLDEIELGETIYEK
ncbi:nucleotidyltransferase domain-containing protein [Candidatus Electronema sp. PJ]|uniref:nucleotidyltransferase domain-containing protein n=1 Tax=Candidatus Electronema sp. PJ TaxID=3401572 RepID=UPI003AA8E2D3